MASFAALLGKLFGVLIFGVVLTAIPLVGASLFGKPLSRVQAWSVFAVSCALAIIGYLVVNK